jgi:hypothetical protein
MHYINLTQDTAKEITVSIVLPEANVSEIRRKTKEIFNDNTAFEVREVNISAIVEPITANGLTKSFKNPNSLITLLAFSYANSFTRSVEVFITFSNQTNFKRVTCVRRVNRTPCIVVLKATVITNLIKNGLGIVLGLYSNSTVQAFSAS